MKVCLACSRRFDTSDWRCPACGESPAVLNGYMAFSPGIATENDGFHPDYFPQLAKLEERNFWFRSRNRLLIWALRRYFPDAGNFLEIGCGTGFALSAVRSELPGLKLWGADVFLDGLAVANTRVQGANLFQMDARHVPFEEEFDVIGAFDVLEHIEQDTDVLSQMFQATKPGGGIIVTVPQHRLLWSPVDEYSFHKRRYSRKELVSKIQNAGFTVVRTASFVFLLLVPMLLSRLKTRRSQGNFDPLAEYGISDFLNSAMGRVLGIERALIKLGFSSPVGGSMLIVARRMGGES